MIYLVNLSEKDYIRKKNKWYVSLIIPLFILLFSVSITFLAAGFFFPQVGKDQRVGRCS